MVSVKNYVNNEIEKTEKTIMENENDIMINGKVTYKTITRLLSNLQDAEFDYAKDPKIDDVQIGHTYFLVTSEDQLFLRFRYQIVPILREYYKDGLFQFEVPETEDGWYGLLGCINGTIDVNSDESRVKDIFDKLTNVGD